MLSEILLCGIEMRQKLISQLEELLKNQQRGSGILLLKHSKMCACYAHLCLQIQSYSDWNGLERCFRRYGYGFRICLFQQHDAIEHPNLQRVTCRVLGFGFRSAGGEEHWSLIGEDPFCRLPAGLADEPFIFISNHKSSTMRAELRRSSNRICVAHNGRT